MNWWFGIWLRKLKNGNRLLPADPCATTAPADAVAWCNEALTSHATEPLNGIICANATKQRFSQHHEIASIEKLTSTSWWRTGSTSAVLDRKTADYIIALSRVLRQANSLMFADPYLDPSESSFRDFYKLLLPLSDRNPAPRIEIHRTCYKGTGRNRVFPAESDWKNAFRSLHEVLQGANLSVEVFLWSEFHDRHLITDVVGIHAGAGFDTTSKPQDLTTWACLSREDRDKIQRLFDPAARPDALRHRFAIGHDSNGN